MLLAALAFASAAAFFYYGTTTITSLRARYEYRRYGVPQFRILNGTLQMFGAGGVLLGLLFPRLGAAASLGLTILMLLGLVTRYRLRDPWRLRVPATILATLNAALFALFLAS